MSLSPLGNRLLEAYKEILLREVPADTPLVEQHQAAWEMAWSAVFNFAAIAPVNPSALIEQLRDAVRKGTASRESVEMIASAKKAKPKHEPEVNATRRNRKRS